MGVTIAELLKAANITDEVIAGLPKDVVTAITGYVSDADTKLANATTEAERAAELNRQTKLDRDEIDNYVQSYGQSLTETASIKAKNDALMSYLNSLKTQGFDIKIPGVEEAAPTAKPAVPGSPAIGGNVDENKILGKVGDVLSQFLDANNEHIRLYGSPIPDPSTQLGEEATRARKRLGEYIAEKYKFADKQAEVKTKAFQKTVDDAVASKLAEEKRKTAEARGSNPNHREGETSRASLMPRVKQEDFAKANGNQSQRERRERMLGNIHRDVEAIRNSA